jgi:peptidoglycan/xylan/chitin deacetylase (PgdA/CDA1 family)
MTSYPTRMLALILFIGGCGSVDPVEHGVEVQNGATPVPLVVRFDDVQDHWLSEVQRAVLNLFVEERIPATLAVIAGFIGEDEPLLRTIRGGGELFEIANHGWHAKSAADGRSILLSQPLDVSVMEIERANDRLTALFGVKPRVFIPHHFDLPAELPARLAPLGFTHVSASSYSHPGNGIRHVPANVSTSWPATVAGELRGEAELFGDIEKAAGAFDCVVLVMHPQDFATKDERLDPARLEYLRRIMRRLQADSTNYRLLHLGRVPDADSAR